MIRASVRDVFSAFSGRFEGDIDHFYPDINGDLTIAKGALVDPVARALDLPMRHRDSGQLADRGVIAAEWWIVKTQADPQRGDRGARPLCKLYLPPADVEALTAQRLAANVAALAKAFPDFGLWPASAQLAVLSMAWAVGTGGLTRDFPKTCAALRAQDWTTAAAEGVIRTDGNPGVIPRNKANKQLFLAAAHQQAIGADPGALLWEPPAPPQIDRGAVLAQLDLSLWASTGQAIEEALAARRREGDG